jgi:hypothetical protein
LNFVAFVYLYIHDILSFVECAALTFFKTRSEDITSARSPQHETSEQPDTGNDPAIRIWEQPRTRSTGDLPRPIPKWILLCFNDYKHSRKAEHVKITGVLSDTELFRQLWKSYSKARGVLFSLFAWKAVTKISFVQVCIKFRC